MHTSIGAFASTTLAGQDLRIPDDLTGPTLLLFAQRQRQQGDVNSWIRVAARDPGLRVLEVPLLGRRWIPARRGINGGMAANMDDATRAMTMCVYTDVTRFKRDILGVTTDEVLATLVDQDGTVHWHAVGPATPAGMATFLEMARALQDPGDPAG